MCPGNPTLANFRSPFREFCGLASGNGETRNLEGQISCHHLPCELGIRLLYFKSVCPQVLTVLQSTQNVPDCTIARRDWCLVLGGTVRTEAKHKGNSGEEFVYCRLSNRWGNALLRVYSRARPSSGGRYVYVHGERANASHKTVCKVCSCN